MVFIFLVLFVNFYRATLCYSAVYAMALRLSVRHNSESYQNG